MQSRLGLLTPPESSLSPDQQFQPVCVKPFNPFKSPVSPQTTIEESGFSNKATREFPPQSEYLLEDYLKKRSREETSPSSSQGMESSGDICMKIRKLAVDSNPSSIDYTSQPQAKNSLIDQAKTFARAHKGECLSDQCSNILQPLSYKCLLGHAWTNNLPLNQGLWCKKCTNKLTIARKFANSHGGILLSQDIDTLLDFQCSLGHRWSANVLKYMNQKWCLECRSQDRKSQRESTLRKEEAEAKKKELEQAKLFAEARSSAENTQSDSQQLRLEAEITRIAEIQTTRFFDDSKNMPNCSHSDALNVYRVLSTSSEVLRTLYFNMERKKATANYRLLAKCLHPDKNKHPQANEAFVKVMKEYMAVMTQGNIDRKDRQE